jgi:hypothetical protein
MIENSTSQIGREVIDAYLDSVEQAMLAAQAPRSDRAQVIQDLESQISDMLAQESRPVTEEMVRAVVAKLEPPSHFAATYGNGKMPPTATRRVVSARPAIRWSRVAAACVGAGIFGALVWLTHVGELIDSNGGLIVCSIAFSLIATPFALMMAFRQLRTQPDRFPDRDFVTKMTIGYAIVAPAFLMVLLTEWTYGFVLMPLGAAAFLYLHYRCVQRLRRYVEETLPPQAAAPNGGAGTESATPPIAMTVPAV